MHGSFTLQEALLVGILGHLWMTGLLLFLVGALSLSYVQGSLVLCGPLSQRGVGAPLSLVTTLPIP